MQDAPDPAREDAGGGLSAEQLRRLEGLNPQIAALGARGWASAAQQASRQEEAFAKAEDDPSQEGTAEEQSIGAALPVRLGAPERAIVETTCARRGFWLAIAGGPRQLVLPFDATDRLGTFTIESGPAGPLTVTELEVLTWLCSRWREFCAPVGARQVPMALAHLAADFGWDASGRNLARLALALDRLRDCAITGEFRVPGERRPRARDRFGLIDMWRAGAPGRPGALTDYGWVSLGEWLYRQLRARHLTYLDFGVLRRLERPVAKRLYAFLEAERFERDPFARRVAGGWEKAWPVDGELNATLGITHRTPRKARETLVAAASEVQARLARYPELGVMPRAGGRGHLLVALRRDPS